VIGFQHGEEMEVAACLEAASPHVDAGWKTARLLE